MSNSELKINREITSEVRNKIRGVINATKTSSYDSNKAHLQEKFQLEFRSIIFLLRSCSLHYDSAGMLKWFHDQIDAQVPKYIKEHKNDYIRLQSVREAPDLTLEAEINWLTEYLSSYHLQLSQFREMADNLESYLWAENYTKVDEILEAIEVQFGKSYWLTEVTIAYLQNKDGLEAHKDYVEEIKAVNRKSIISYFAHFTSARNEPNATLKRVEENVEQRIKRLNIDDSLKVFLNYKLASKWPERTEDLARILKTAQNFSLIDAYETYVTILQYILSEKREDEDLLHFVEKSLLRLSSVKDWRLSKALLHLGHFSELEKFQSTDFKTCELMLSGKFTEAFSNGERHTLYKSLDTSQVFMAALSSCFSGAQRKDADTASGQLIQYLSRRYSKAEGFLKRDADVLKQIKNLSTLPSMRALYELSNFSVCSIATMQDMSILKMSALNNRHFGLEDFLLALQQKPSGWKEAFQFQDFFKQIYPIYSALAKGEDVEQLNNPFVNQYLKVLLNCSQQNYEAAYQELKKIDAGMFDEHVVLKLLEIDLNVRNNNFLEVINLASFLVTKTPSLSEHIPVTKLFQGARWQDIEHLSGNIGLPITLYIASRLTRESSVKTLLRVAAYKFLNSQSINVPSQLQSEQINIEREQLIYVLRNIYTQQRLEMNFFIKSSAEVSKERINVLRILCSIDPANDADYQTEIFLIERELKIQDGMRVVDGSRVFVDTDYIKAWAEKELAEPFARYTDLVGAGKGVSQDFDEVLESLRKSNAAKLMVPDNEADELLVNMVEALKEKFLYDPVAGLHIHLSKRIRHGSVVQHMRKPVEETKLITQRRDEGKSYQVNEYWLSRFSHLPNSDYEKLSKSFLSFSQQFDDVAVKLRDDLLQIRSTSKPHGMLLLEPSANVYTIIRSSTQSNMDLETFVLSCLHVFWAILETSLKSVRQHLKKETQKEIELIFARLRGTVSRVAQNESEFHNLSATIGAAASDTQRVVDQISTWFNQPVAQNHLNIMEIKEAIDIAVGICLDNISSFEPEVRNTFDATYKIPEANLCVLHEIFWVLIENVKKHSGIETKPIIEITGHVDNEQGTMNLSFVSNIADSAKNELAQKRLEEIQEKIAKNPLHEDASKDRKSGLIKIANVVNQSKKGSLDFGFDENKKIFYVDIVFSFVLGEDFLPEECDEILDS